MYNYYGGMPQQPMQGVYQQQPINYGTGAGWANRIGGYPGYGYNSYGWQMYMQQRQHEMMKAQYEAYREQVRSFQRNIHPEWYELSDAELNKKLNLPDFHTLEEENYKQRQKIQEYNQLKEIDKNAKQQCLYDKEYEDKAKASEEEYRKDKSTILDFLNGKKFVQQAIEVRDREYQDEMNDLSKNYSTKTFQERLMKNLQGVNSGFNTDGCFNDPSVNVSLHTAEFERQKEEFLNAILAE